MPAVMKVVGLVNGGRTPADGEYVAEYDPDLRGHDRDGRPMLCHLVTTPDVTHAKRYASTREAMEEWQRVSTRWPTRPHDGQPNRPLTAYNVELTDVDA
jgi:hypothetical protein